jgi:taurine dioxygenase
MQPESNAAASRFGALEDHPVLPSHPEAPGLVQIHKSPDSPPDRYENAWHSDTSWRETPAMGCVLRCVACPDTGGDTLWANMVQAYEKLPEAVRRDIADLVASHSFEATFGAAQPAERRLAMKAQYPDGCGQDYTRGGAELLQYLIGQAGIPEYQVRWRWRPNSVAIWDNRATQHYAVRDYPPPASGRWTGRRSWGEGPAERGAPVGVDPAPGAAHPPIEGALQFLGPAFGLGGTLGKALLQVALG